MAEARLDEFLSPRIDVEINRIAKEESISASDIFSIPSEGKRNAKKRPAFAKRGLSQQIVVLQPDPSFITSSESSSKGEPSDQKTTTNRSRVSGRKSKSIDRRLKNAPSIVWYQAPHRQSSGNKNNLFSPISSQLALGNFFRESRRDF